MPFLGFAVHDHGVFLLYDCLKDLTSLAKFFAGKSMEDASSRRLKEAGRQVCQRGWLGGHGCMRDCSQGPLQHALCECMYALCILQLLLLSVPRRAFCQARPNCFS